MKTEDAISIVLVIVGIVFLVLNATSYIAHQHEAGVDVMIFRTDNDLMYSAIVCFIIATAMQFIKRERSH